MSTTRPLELLQMDLFGTTTYRSIGGNSFCLVMDDYSRLTWVFYLHDKSKVLDIFTGLAQNEFDYNIKKVTSDNGTELKNCKLR